MTKVTVLKYSSNGKYSDIKTAQEKVNSLKEKHPDREYTILYNTRTQSSYNRFSVAQVREVVLDWPDEDKLDLPPVPPQPPWSFRYSSNAAEKQQYEDYEFAKARWKRERDKIMGPLEAQIDEKMNP